MRFHIQHLRDSSLHNEKIRIVYVQLHRTKQIRNFFIQNRFAVNQILSFAAHKHLPGDRYFSTFFVTDWTLTGVRIIKKYCNGCFRNACLATFEHKLL